MASVMLSLSSADADMEMQHLGARTYRQHQDPESGLHHYPALHGGRYPTSALSQSDLHRNLRRNIERSTLEGGYRRPAASFGTSPIPPADQINQTSSTWASSTPRRIPDRISPPPSPLNESQARPIPARRLRGGFAGAEKDI